MTKTRFVRRLCALSPIALVIAAASSAFGQGSTCATATDIFNNQTYSGNTAGAPSYTNAGLCAGSGRPSQWFKYTATANGAVTFSTCSSTGTLVDTVLSAHSDCTNNIANVLACDDDGCNVRKSTITVTVATGQVVYVRASQWDAATGTYTLAVGPIAAPPPPPTNGPDVATWRVESVARTGDVGGIAAFAIGSTSTNYGDVPVDWRDGDSSSASNKSPVIAQNLYKLKNGRFTQLGQSWLKHGFSSTNSPGGAGSCQQPPLGGNQLGINCLDTYGSGLNGNQVYLGPRSVVNSTTGYFAPVTNGSMPTGDSIYKRLQVPAAQLEVSDGANIRYFSEIYYVTYDDATWGNALNNATYTESALNTTTGAPANFGTMYQRDPAILAWNRADPTVVNANADHIFTLISFGSQGDASSHLPTLPRDITCRYIVASKVTDNGNGTWHYEYAVYNHNSDRSAYSFSMRLPAGALVTGEGVAFPRSHSGEPFSNGAWTVDKLPGLLTFKADATYAANPTANAIRWGTMYTFWFDVNVAPTTGQGRITLFKPSYSGTDPSILVPANRLGNDTATWAFASGIRVPAYCLPDIASLGGALAPDGQLTVDDLVAYLSQFFSGNLMVADVAALGGALGADGMLTVDDLVAYLSSFFTPCN